MDEILSQVDDRWLRVQVLRCERLIRLRRADLADFELYVSCQRELARRSGCGAEPVESAVDPEPQDPSESDLRCTTP